MTTTCTTATRLLADLDVTVRPVPGADHAAAVTVNDRKAIRRARALLEAHGLLVDRDRELLVASVPQPAASAIIAD